MCGILESKWDDKPPIVQQKLQNLSFSFYWLETSVCHWISVTCVWDTFPAKTGGSEDLFHSDHTVKTGLHSQRLLHQKEQTLTSWVNPASSGNQTFVWRIFYKEVVTWSLEWLAVGSAITLGKFDLESHFSLQVLKMDVTFIPLIQTVYIQIIYIPVQPDGTPLNWKAVFRH